MVAVLPLLVSVCVSVALGVTAAGGAAPTGMDVAGEPTIEMTVDNWGEPVSTLDPDEHAWGRIFEAGTPESVTTLRVTIDTGGGTFMGYAAHLSSPDLAFDNDQYCADENHTITSSVTCSFTLALAEGPNRLDFVFQANNADAGVRAQGIVYGGVASQISAFQVQDTYRAWRFVGDGGRVALPATQRSAVQYLLENTGTMPLRLPGSCSHSLLYPGSQLVCPVRSARPGAVLGGPYRLELQIVDPTGAHLDTTLTMRVAVPGVRR
ncbi:hypothetical protein BH11ACT3_BH11ACT3_18080 [soil metagenome]